MDIYELTVLCMDKKIINPRSISIYPHIMETVFPHARHCVITQNKGNINIENISVSYDWESAALLALKNGRTDWAGWIRTGRAFL